MAWDARQGKEGRANQADRDLFDELRRMRLRLQELEAHAATHEDGGTDEIDVTGLTGLLATAQTPTAHETTHRAAGSDPLSVLNLAGFPGGTVTFLRADATFAAPAGGAGGDLAKTLLVQDENQSLAANVGVYAPDYYEIGATFELEIGVNAVMEIG